MISKSNRYKTKGVALLMSMSVVLLLSIALMKTFEKRSLEVAHLGHNLDRFQAENLSRSGLKLILLSIKKAGLVTINAYLEQLKQVEFPVGNGTMKIMEIRPVDYRFNLNTKIGRETDPRIDVFDNIVTASKSADNEYNYLSGENTNEALSAIIDWTDSNDAMDEVFRFDSEQYPREEPAFKVKNREFDRLSEVRLLPAFRALGFKTDFLEQNFRVTNGDGSEDFIDVNLTREADMRLFLKRYEGVEGYSSLPGQREEIIQMIMTRRATNGSQMSAEFKPMDPPFPAKEFERKWVDQLKPLGITTLAKGEKALFKPHSNYLFIHYQVHVGQVTLNIRSMVKVVYKNLDKNLNIGGLTILWLRIS